jgi:hypothetical protein
MGTYAVDPTRTVLVGTGNVDAVMEWEAGADGGRRPSSTQARDEGTGMPLWGVEVLVPQVTWGRSSMVTARVTVGAPARPALAQFAPLGFRGLVVEVRVNRTSGALVESWRAEELTAPSTPISSTSSKASGGTSSAVAA